jgi:uncharacterized membrane protein YdjX (TVP38/TMEM64 family)
MLGNTARSILGLAWFTVGPVLMGSWLTYYVLAHGADVGTPIVLLALGITGLVGLALLPTTLVALLGGYLAGFESLYFTIGTYLPAALLGYTLATFFKPKGLEQWLHTRKGFTDTLERLKAGGWQTVFWLRLSPAVPFGIGNLAMAWAGMPLRAVLIGSLPGMLPRTVLATYAGHQAHSLAEALKGGAQADTAQLWATAGLLGAATLGLYLQSKIKRKG